MGVFFWLPLLWAVNCILMYNILVCLQILAENREVRQYDINNNSFLDFLYACCLTPGCMGSYFLRAASTVYFVPQLSYIKITVMFSCAR